MAFFNPFCSEEAFTESNYCSLQHKDFTIKKPIEGRKKKATEKIANKLSAFVGELEKPGQLPDSGSVKKQRCFGVYNELGSTKATAGLCRDLAQFLYDLKEGTVVNDTFMAVFITPAKLSQTDFGPKVKAQLELLKKAAEPFYCVPESIEPAQLNTHNHMVFGGRVIKVVSIYRNNSQGQLKFDYPMLAFTVQAIGQSAINPVQDKEPAVSIPENGHE